MSRHAIAELPLRLTKGAARFANNQRWIAGAEVMICEFLVPLHTALDGC